MKTLGCVLLLPLMAACTVAGDQRESFINSIGMELVMVPAGYRVGKYEVTQRQYEQIMDRNPSRWHDPQRPVENVDWKDATTFCEAMTRMDIAAGVIAVDRQYTLPTEAQWTYFVADAELDDMVHSRWNGLEALGTMPIGSLGPNKFGLHDVRGNVWEWTHDWWDNKQYDRVVRGGSWDLVHPEDLKITYRPVSPAVARDGNIGFRVVLEKRASPVR
jgi:formylglycine-generating enzyme required for sulfatase activity